tara:strand:+ start:2806 stop:3048 length:243 start_codon:yes stop_codon:yes gene_type:complete
MEHLAGLAEIIGPIGVLVVVVAWAIISRRQNGRGFRCRSGCPPIVIARLDALREDISEVKSDVRDLRSGVVRHLEDHANS